MRGAEAQWERRGQDAKKHPAPFVVCVRKGMPRSFRMHGLMCTPYFFKTVGRCPTAVGRCQDCLVRKRSRAAPSQRSESLIQPVPFQKAEYEQCAGKLAACISSFGGRDRFYACEKAERVVGMVGGELF